MGAAMTSETKGCSISDWRMESDDSIAMDIWPTLTTACSVTAVRLRDELYLLPEQLRQLGTPPELLDRCVPRAGGGRRLRWRQRHGVGARRQRGDTLQKVKKEKCESSGLGLGAGGVRSLDRSLLCVM